MTKLFIYGTLQQPEVQLELLGRVIDGEVDSIENYIVVRDYVDPEDGVAYPRIKQYENGCTFGKILDVSDNELVILDKYETAKTSDTNASWVIMILLVLIVIASAIYFMATLNV